MNHTTIILITLALLTVLNIVSFALMAIDKRRARRGAWRVSERTLFLATACFGGLGGVLGMQLLRHKTQHWYFRVFFPVLLALQIVALAAGAYFLFKLIPV